MIIQPNNFTVCNDCECATGTCRPPYLAKLNDFFSYEITELQSILGANVIVNPNFTTNLNDWTQTNLGLSDWVWDAGTCKISAAGTSEKIYQTADFSLTSKISFTFYHSAIAAASTLKVYLEIGGAWVLTSTYSDLAAGTAYVTVNSGTVTNIAFEAIDTAGDNFIYIDNVTAQDFDPASFELRNCCNDAVIGALHNADIVLYSDHAEIKFRFSTYASLGQQVKLCYDKQIITDGIFNLDLSNWEQIYQDGETTGAAWTWVTGDASVDLTTISKVLQQSIFLERGCEYTITADFTGSTGTTINVTMQTDDLSLNENFDLTTNLTVTKTFTFTPEYTGYQNIRFFSELGLSGGTNIMYLDDVSIIAEYCSPCYDINDHDCSLLVEATNDNGGFGLSEDYYGTIRIEGEIHKIKTDYKENIYRNTQGMYKNIFTDIAIIYELSTYLLHTDQLMGLLTLLSFDNLQINKQYYVKKEGSIEIQWDDKNEYGMFTCELYLKEQQQQKDYS